MRETINLYGGAPELFQSALLSGRGMLRALALELSGAWACRQRLQHTEAMSAAELAGWHGHMLTALMRHAAAHVPHYAQQRAPTLAQTGQAARILADWPLLHKQDLVRAGSTLVTDERKARLSSFAAYTSGTTGSPVKLLRTAHSIALEDALVERQMRWAGWRRGMRRVWLRGDVVVPLRSEQAPFWRYNKAQAMLMCSSFHLTEKNAPLYLQVLERFDPVLIQAYPSAIAFLARWMRDSRHRYRAPSLRGIMTSSERLTDEWRRDCERAFGVRVFDWFGQSERVGAIGTCELGNYHLIEDGSYIELQPRGDGSATVVGTTFGNDVMPLIRYRTADCVVPADHGYRCPCLRHFRVIEQIHGRETDAIVTPDGRQHIMLDFIFDDLTALQEGQIVQEAADAIVINVALHPGRTLAEVRDTLLTRALARLGPAVLIEIREVAQVGRTASGKFPLIVSRLKRKSATAS